MGLIKPLPFVKYHIFVNFTVLNDLGTDFASYNADTDFVFRRSQRDARMDLALVRLTLGGASSTATETTLLPSVTMAKRLKVGQLMFSESKFQTCLGSWVSKEG